MGEVMEDNQNGPKPVGHALLSALDRLSASREAYVKRVEASALPGETFEQTEMRLRREQDQRDRARAAMPNGSIKPVT